MSDEKCGLAGMCVCGKCWANTAKPSESPGLAGSTLPGLTEDETRYFQWLLCRKLSQTTYQQWQDLTVLNQKILKEMSDSLKA